MRTTTTPAASGGLADLLADPVVATLRAAFTDARLYLVGGPVREALRGRLDMADLDFASDALPDELLRRLDPIGPVWTAGARFGTIGVSVRVPGRPPMKVEVTTFRREVYRDDSRKPDVGFGDDIVDDLRRRDLTVNAAALDVHTGALVDPFGAAAALAARLLDTPDDPDRTISEDPLRALRALRFAAKLDATLAPRLATAISRNAGRLSIVAVERRTDELRKVLQLGPSRARALRAAAELGVAAYLLGDLTVDEPALTALERAADVTGALAVLAVVSGPHASRHLRALRLPGDVTAPAVTVARVVQQLRDEHQAILNGRQPLPVARRLLRAYDDMVLTTAEKVAEDLDMAVAAVTAAICVVKRDDPQVRAPLPVRGDELAERGLRGPDIGAALRRIEQARCERGPLTRHAAFEVAGV